MTGSIILTPIGFVKSAVVEPQEDFWADVVSEIVLDIEQVGSGALDGLEGFSHVEVIFYFHAVKPEKIHRGARHPRGLQHLPEVGILAQRAKGRPNRLGLSRCELVGVEQDRIVVKSLDAIDGTPVLDIKPYMAEFAPRGEIRQPAWTKEVMASYYAKR